MSAPLLPDLIANLLSLPPPAVAEYKGAPAVPGVRRSSQQIDDSVVALLTARPGLTEKDIRRAELNMGKKNIATRLTRMHREGRIKMDSRARRYYVVA